MYTIITATMSDNEDNDIFKDSDSDSGSEIEPDVDVEVDVESEADQIKIEDDGSESEPEPEQDDDDNEIEEEVEEDDVGAVSDDEDENDIVPQIKQGKTALPPEVGSDSDSDSEADADENYLQKFDTEIKKNYIVDFHPECMIHNYEEISALTVVLRDKDNIIIDPLHRTIPFLTKYERARVLGQRAKQLNAGSRPFVKVPENVIDGYLVAELELMQKRIPFIIRRPLPGRSGCEYWNLKDLEIIGF